MASAAVRDVIARLSTPGWGLSALLAAVESGVVAGLRGPATLNALEDLTGLEPRLVEALVDVLVSLELATREGDLVRPSPELSEVATGRPLDLVRAELRQTTLQNADLAERAIDGALEPGWTHEDPRLLVAQGVMSAIAVDGLEERVFPMLEGIPEALRDGAAFLDVGAGVAAGSIELCRRFPRLRAVGLEPADAPMALARRAVADAGLEGRIQLRRQLVQDLPDEDEYDLAWLPLMFLAPEVAPAAIGAVFRALRPGGWLLTGTLGSDESTLEASVARLRAVLWGGAPYAPAEVRDMLGAAGFTASAAGPVSPAGLTPMFARRPN